MRRLRIIVSVVTLSLSVCTVNASPSYDISTLPNYITMYGDRSGGTLITEAPGAWSSFLYDALGINNFNENSAWIHFMSPGMGLYENCPSSVYIDPDLPWIPADSAEAFLSWVDMRMGQGVRMTSPIQKNILVNPEKHNTSISCIIVNSPDQRKRMTIKWGTGDQSHSGKPPDPVKPICTLGNDIVFNFTSNSLNVAGLQQQRTVPIVCSAGGLSASYRLRLTSSSESNGNILFGNNVGVSFMLGSTALPVNGNGISLSLTSSYSPILTATLTGTAISVGKTDASGILILEAL